eukprot:TRINITY_DN17488_c0_g1_i1.p1 TRINITY_DN17488_c0_g1~~TRINITY_DN17488_c0_g1_i1.p1  ORF type:complete len:114 (+),score=15.09 TRINITY_DN17488_c0_g1_i1:328-669(+)
MTEKNELLAKIAKLEQKSNGNDGLSSHSSMAAGVTGKKKRQRRTATEIDRHYRCPLCVKSYGSEGSLAQHIKLKHPGFDYKPGSVQFVENNTEAQQESQTAKATNLSFGGTQK